MITESVGGRGVKGRKQAQYMAGVRNQLSPDGKVEAFYGKRPGARTWQLILLAERGPDLAEDLRKFHGP